MDLPAELLHEICHGLETRTLLRLSQMCRSLFDTTQVIIFKRQIAHLQVLVNSGNLNTKPSKAIASLMGREDTPLNFIQLYLTDSSALAETLYSCYGLISRKDCVGHVELYLSSSVLRQHPAAAPARWKQLAAVMNAVIEKPGSTLTVTDKGGNWEVGERPFTYTITSKATSSSASPPVPSSLHRKEPFPIIRQVLRLCVGRRTKFKARMNGTADSQPIKTDELSTHIVQELRVPSQNLPRHSLPLLQAFHIHSCGLLHLPFFPWTLDTLNRAPITTLSFRNIDLGHQDWAYILRNITIPTLSALSLGSSQVAFLHLQSFLERHSSITILNLVEGLAIGRLVPHSSEKLLPRLVELAGNSEYLAHFLQPLVAHPNLYFVVMTSEYGITAHEYSRFDEVFELIAQRNQTMSLALLLLSEFGLLEWLQSCGVRPMKNVARLEISTGERFIFSSIIKRAINDWLRLFPSLLHLRFTDSFGRLNEGNSVHDIGSLWDRHPQLETVKIGRSTYSRP